MKFLITYLFVCSELFNNNLYDTLNQKFILFLTLSKRVLLYSKIIGKLENSDLFFLFSMDNNDLNPGVIIM